MSNRINVLAVDDEEINLDIIQEYIGESNMECITAHDGIEALDRLESSNDSDIDVIILDRMMPNMNGMEFLKKIKGINKYKDIPVIMQTAASANHQVAEGIDSGVFYYLSKPYSKDVLLSLIKAADYDHKRKSEMRFKIEEYAQAMSMIQKGEFRFKTVQDAKILAILIGSCMPEPEMMAIGLTELMINAVEHGNLAITYEEKRELKLANKWEAEIEAREKLAENILKYCEISIVRDQAADEFIVNIKDQGNGFDWTKFDRFDPNRLTDPNGRGIVLSQNSGFDNVQYLGKGNEVQCTVSTTKDKGE
ncbi:MAG: response regulator [Alphaproteobacteria bacterium]|jgi:CheY-like chemotaxis protein|nr:response regulator [Candidatus Jidaibacter sp.]